MRGFVRRGEEIHIDLAPAETYLLGLAPQLLATVDLDDVGDPASARLRYRARPDDDEADDRFRELTERDLASARSVDRVRFVDSMERGTLDLEDAEAWLRVLGEARLVLAARLGIEEDGWEHDTPQEEPAEMLLLRLLGAVQNELVGVLLDSF